MASGNDMKAANSTYEGFINALKWIIPLLSVITLFIIVVISE